MNEFTIKDLENLTGIRAHTIRIWEQRYGILKPKRSKTNIRYYHTDELKSMLNVALLNKFGFRISEISRMDADTIRQKILSLENDTAVQERIVNSLLHCMVDLNTEEFGRILDEHISRRGIDHTINFLIFPFLHKIGILWLTDHIRVAQEHLVSNMIRQKLILGIEKAPAAMPTGRSVAMFLPEGEHHEIGLLYMHYMMKSRGVRVIYLGADVPVEELGFVCTAMSPDCLYTHLTSLPPRFNADKFLTAISTRIRHTPVLISGKAASAWQRRSLRGISFPKSIGEAIDSIAGAGTTPLPAHSPV